MAGSRASKRRLEFHELLRTPHTADLVSFFIHWGDRNISFGHPEVPKYSDQKCLSLYVLAVSFQPTHLFQMSQLSNPETHRQ